MHDLLFENQPHLKLHQLRSYAERLDVDLARYAVEMEHHVAVNEIGRDDDALLDNLTADQSCGTLIAPNRWLFPIMIVVSAADREWQLTL